MTVSEKKIVCYSPQDPSNLNPFDNFGTFKAFNTIVTKNKSNLVENNR